MTINEYLDTFRCNQIDFYNQKDAIGKTVAYIDLSDGSNDFSIVFTDKTFFIGEIVNDYYDSHYIGTASLSIYHIYSRYNKQLTEFGKAIGADLDICMQLCDEEDKANADAYKERRRLEYEKLKAEFEGK